ESLAGAHERMTEWVHLRRYVAHRDRSARPVKLTRAQRVMLELFEVGQHIVPAPTRVAGGPPVIEVRRVSAHVHHRVDGARTTDDLAAGPVSATLLELWIGLCLVHPVEARMSERAPVTDRHPYPGAQVRASGLQQQDAVAVGLGQPMRQN